jgi:hypothetical protein
MDGASDGMADQLAALDQIDGATIGTGQRAGTLGHDGHDPGQVDIQRGDFLLDLQDGQQLLRPFIGRRVRALCSANGAFGGSGSVFHLSSLFAMRILLTRLRRQHPGALWALYGYPSILNITLFGAERNMVHAQCGPT